MMSALNTIRKMLEEKVISLDTIFSYKFLSMHELGFLIDSGVTSVAEYYELQGDEMVRSFMEDLHKKLNPYGKEIEYQLIAYKGRKDVCIKFRLEKEGSASEKEAEQNSGLWRLITELAPGNKELADSLDKMYRPEVLDFFEKIKEKMCEVRFLTPNMELRLTVDEVPIFSISSTENES